MATTYKSKRSKSIPKPYRSGLEVDVAKEFSKRKLKFKYEDTKLKYQVNEEKTYTPDFRIDEILFESKGRLTSFDRKKMKAIKIQYPNKRIIFIFANSRKRINKGSPTTYAMWCEKNSYEYFDLKQLKQDKECLSFLTKK